MAHSINLLPLPEIPPALTEKRYSSEAWTGRPAHSAKTHSIVPYKSVRGQFYYWRRWLRVEFHKAFCGDAFVSFHSCVCNICGTTWEEMTDHMGWRLPARRGWTVS